MTAFTPFASHASMRELHRRSTTKQVNKGEKRTLLGFPFVCMLLFQDRCALLGDITETRNCGLFLAPAVEDDKMTDAARPAERRNRLGCPEVVGNERGNIDRWTVVQEF